MTVYYLTAFEANDLALAVMRRAEGDLLGWTLSQMFNDGSLPANLCFAKELMRPRPIVLGGVDDPPYLLRPVGHYLGFHYDECPTGVGSTRAPLVPPRSVVFTTSGYAEDHLSCLTGEALAHVIREIWRGASLAQAKRDTDRVFARQTAALHPVLFNDSAMAVPLHVFQSTAFRPGEEAVIETLDDQPFGFPPGFNALERASSLGLGNEAGPIPLPALAS